MNLAKRQVTEISFTILLFLAAFGTKAAEDHPASGPFESALPLFACARSEITLNNAVLFSPFVATRHRPTIDYTITELQFGYMLTDVKKSGWLRGNFEVLGDGFAGGVFKGAGTYVAGATAWLRYNLVLSHNRVTPYAQAGAGFVATDIDRGIVGQEFNFNLDLGIGMRYFIRPRWSLNLEYRYQHISNANLGRKNIGINAHGPVLGVSYFF